MKTLFAWTLVLLFSTSSSANQACVDFVKNGKIVEIKPASFRVGIPASTTVFSLNDYQLALLCRYSNGPDGGDRALKCMNGIEGALKKADALTSDGLKPTLINGHFRHQEDGKLRISPITSEFPPTRKWTAYAQLCSGTKDVTLAANCVQKVLTEIGSTERQPDGSPNLMTGLGVATVCANSARPEYAIKCLKQGNKHLVLDKNSPEGLWFGSLPDFCVNGPSNSTLDDATIRRRISCVDPQLKEGDFGLLRSTAPTPADKTCDGDPNPSSGTKAIKDPAPGTLDPRARVSVCAFDKGSNGLCCARRLLEKGICPNQEFAAEAVGLACQSVSADNASQTIRWGDIGKCMAGTNRTCPGQDSYLKNALVCGSGWGIAPASQTKSAPGEN